MASLSLVSRYFDLTDPPTLIWLQGHAKRRKDHEFGGSGMQEWLGAWRARFLAGEDVEVKMARDGSRSWVACGLRCE